MEHPTVEHMDFVERLMSYINNTINYGLSYLHNSKGHKLVGYSDRVSLPCWRHQHDEENVQSSTIAQKHLEQLAISQATLCCFVFLQGRVNCHNNKNNSKPSHVAGGMVAQQSYALTDYVLAQQPT